MISMIACMTKNRVIGVNNTLPWKQRNDMQRFKGLTWGSEVLMGRKTWESIGCKPLPGRPTTVVSRDKEFHKTFFDNPKVTNNEYLVEDIHHYFRDYDLNDFDNVFIVGGEQIYKQTIQYAYRLYLTVLDVEIDGDAFFPEFGNEWKLIAEEKYSADEHNQYGYNFLTYVRK